METYIPAAFTTLAAPYQVYVRPACVYTGTSGQLRIVLEHDLLHSQKSV